MPKTYISNLRDFLDASELPVASPTSLRRMGEFLASIVNTVTPKWPTYGCYTGVRCRKRGCKGVIHASLEAADGRIGWCCLDCEQYGYISGWHGTKWDHTAGRSTPVVPKYTPRQGEYLAFIYRYTKIHHRSPSEGDIGDYFRLFSPAVRDMLRKLKQKGLISWEPGRPRSIRLLLSREELPDME